MIGGGVLTRIGLEWKISLNVGRWIRSYRRLRMIVGGVVRIGEGFWLEGVGFWCASHLIC